MPGFFLSLDMQFAHPLFLIALSALAIPIIVHLFNFRKYKRIYFTNVDFLENIQQETRKNSQLRQLLILISRLLAVAALVLAFAQPYILNSIQKRDQFTQQSVCIYVDNSYSMEAIATEGRLIDIAKARALEIASTYSPSDLFMIVTNDFEGRHQRLTSKEDFIRNLNEIHVSPTSRSLPEIVSRINEIVNQQHNDRHDAYIISDFQQSNLSLDHAHPDSLINWYLLPLTAEKNKNLYIDTIYFQSPLHQQFQTVNLHVRIVNSSQDYLDKIPVKLTINNIQKAVAAVSIGKEASIELDMPYTESTYGIQHGLVEIADYPVTYDDKYYFSYEIKHHIPVLLIYDREPNKFLNALFQGDSTVHLNTLDSKHLDFSQIHAASTVIIDGIPDISSGLSQELLRFINTGGTLILFPPENSGIQTYNTFLHSFGVPDYGVADTNRERVSYLNLNNEIYRDIFERDENQRLELPINPDLPNVMKYYQTVRYQGDKHSEILLGMENKASFLTLIRFGQGKIYRFQVPLNEQWSDFPRHLIFVPSIYNMVLMSVPVTKLWYETGTNQTIEFPPDTIRQTEIVQLQSVQSDFKIIPEIQRLGTSIRIQTHDQIKIPGNFTVLNNNRIISGISFNINRKESDLLCFTRSELNDQINKIKNTDIQIITNKSHALSQELLTLKKGVPLWKWFLISSLIFLFAEIVLIRFFHLFDKKTSLIT